MSLIGAILNAAPTKTPVPMVGRSQGGLFGAFTRQAGTTQQLSAMEASGTVFNIVDRIATAVSLVNWQLWRKAKSGKKEDRTEITSHLALDVWNKPNDFYTRQELVEVEQQHQELTGEAWTVVGYDPRASKIPLELWPIRPDRMEPVPSHDAYLLGYTYRSFDGEMVPLERKDVLFMRRPDPNNPYRGLGPIKPILVDIDSSRAAAEWNRSFFANSAEPGGIVEVEKRLSDDEFDELTRRWAEQHQGVSRAHSVAILENGVKWVDRKYTMRDMEFTELRGVTASALREAFGFPKFMAGLVDDVNRANAEASEAMFAQWLVVPRLERWKAMLNTEFLPLFGATADGLEFDYIDPVPENSEAENTARTSKVGAVASLVPLGFDAKESLKAFGLPDIPWTKPEPPAPPPGAGFPPGQKPPGKGFPPGQKKDPLQALLRNQAPTDDPDLARVQADWEAALERLLADWRQVTHAQRAEIRAQVRDAVAAGDMTALANLRLSHVDGAAVLTAALIALALVSARRMAAELAAQGAPPIEPPPPDESALGQVGAAAALLLAGGLAGLAAGAAIAAFRFRPAVPGSRRPLPGMPGTPVSPAAPPAVPAQSSPDEVVAAVDAALDERSDRALRDALGGALTTSQNQARLLTAQAVEHEIERMELLLLVTYIATEQNDSSTCWQCMNVDGTQYASWIDAWIDYGGGKYRGCEGRNRCRGTIIARVTEVGILPQVPGDPGTPTPPDDDDLSQYLIQEDEKPAVVQIGMGR